MKFSLNIGLFFDNLVYYPKRLHIKLDKYILLVIKLANTIIRLCKSESVGKYMNVNELMKKSKLSPMEHEIVTYIMDNLENLELMSIKKIANNLSVNESLVTKSSKKLGFDGFKDMKQALKKFYLYKQSNDIRNDFFNTLIADLKNTKNILDFNIVDEVITKIVQNKNKRILIFATGKTFILAKYFYFTLLEYGINVEIESSLYNEKVFDVKDAFVFVLSVSGNNNKIHRYLNLLKSNNNQEKIIAITSTQEFSSKNLVDYHIYGNVHKYFSEDYRANPIVEKYILMFILDNILLNFLEKLQEKNVEIFKNIKSKNFM